MRLFGFWGFLFALAMVGMFIVADTLPEVEATGAWNGQDRYHVPMAWCAVQGSPASVPIPVTGLNGVTDTSTDAILWRRHERPTDNIYANQVGITLRSAINDSWGTLNFPIIADPDPTQGVPGDMRGEDVNTFGIEYNNLINNCDTAWTNLGRAGVGITAVNANLFHDGGGDYVGVVGWGGCTRNASNVCVAGYDGRIVVVDNNYLYPTVADRTFPPSPADPGGTLQFSSTDSLDQLTGHESGHALGLPHRTNNFALMNPTMTDNNGDGDTDNININNTETTSVRSSAQIVPGLEVDPPGVVLPGEVQAEYLVAPVDPKWDFPNHLKFNGLNLILDQKANTFSIGMQHNGVFPARAEPFFDVFLGDLDANPNTGVPADVLREMGIPSDFKGADVIARADVVGRDIKGQAWEWDGEQVVPIDSFVRFSLLGLVVEPYCADTIRQTRCAKDGPYLVRNIIQASFDNKLVEYSLGKPIRVQALTAGLQGELVNYLDPTDEGVKKAITAPEFPQCFPDGDGQAGGKVPVKYEGFPPNSRLHALLGPDLVTTAVADEQGNGTLDLPIPSDAGPGHHLVTIGVDDTALTADCGLYVLPSPLQGDHYLGYAVRVGGPFAPVDVELRDQFEKGRFKVIRPDQLYNPTVKMLANGETSQIVDRSTHLLGYPIVPAQRFTPVKKVLLVNQFGFFQVNATKPVKLLVPSAKGHGSPVPAPGDADHRIDHYKCYSVTLDAAYDPNKLFPLTAFLLDQFEQQKWYDVARPTMLCNPVEKALGNETSPIKNIDNHLLCYRISPGADEPRHQQVTDLRTNNQFGPARMNTVAARELCVPSRKLLKAG
jgi:hypothetical protein